MTDARRDLIIGMLWVFLIGLAVANHQWLLAAGALLVALFVLRPLWRIAARRVEALRRTVEAAEEDPSARRARGAHPLQRRAPAPHKRSEDT